MEKTSKYNMNFSVLTLTIAKEKTSAYQNVFTLIKNNHCKSRSG